MFCCVWECMWCLWCGSVLCVVVCGCVGMEGGRRRCFTEKAVDLPEGVIVFCFSLQFQALSHMLTLRQHMEKCLKLQREAKKMTRCGRSTAPPPSHAKKHVSIMYLCTHATQHTPHGPHTVSSRLVSFSSLLFSSLLFSSLLFSSLLFSSLLFSCPSLPQSC